MMPAAWKIQYLGEIADISSGGTPRRDNADYWDGDIPWITTSQVDFCTINHADQHITQAGLTNSAAKLLPAGTLLMALYGQGKTRGKVAKLGITAATNQACAAISIRPGTDENYVFHFLESRYEQIRNASNGGSQDNLSGLIVKKLPITLPSFEEQRAIASTLSDMDTLLAKLDQLIAKKRDIKLAEMQELLTGRRRLPGFSDVWRTQKLRDGISLLSGQHVLAEHCNTDGIGCPYITGPSDFQDGKIQHSKFTTSPTTLCQVDDILITVKGSGVGAMVMSDGTYCISRQLMAIRVESDWCTQFIHQLLQQDASLIGAAATGLIPGISRSDILNKEIHTPRAAEQTAIAAVLSDMDTEITALEARREKTRLIKHGMMQELLSGRVRLI